MNTSQSSNYRWSAEEEHLLHLLRPTNTYQEIEIEFQKRVDRGIKGFRCTRSSEAIRKKCQRDNIEGNSYTEDDNPVVERWDEIRDIQETYKQNCLFQTRGLPQTDKRLTKILSLSDIHFPLARIDLIEEALKTHADADIVVVNGDLLEGYVFSTFDKNKTIAAIDEYRAAFGFVRMLSDRFPQVVLVEGNHDDRVSRHLKKQGFSKDQTQILRPNLIARIANGELLDSSGHLIEKLDFHNVIYEQQESWYVKIGKTLFIHPSTRGSSKPGYTVQNWYTKFSERYGKDEFDSIVCGHTHQVYKGVWCSTLLIEQGCLVGLLSYGWGNRHIFKGNGQNGYAVIYQDEHGNTDFNKSQVIFLGEVLPPKKSAI